MGDILDRILHRLPGGKAKTPVETRILTLRIPADLHNELRQEAHVRGVSVNKLCQAKLLVTAEQMDRWLALERLYGAMSPSPAPPCDAPPD